MLYGEEKKKLKEALEACNKELEQFVISLLASDKTEELEFSKKKYPNIFKIYTTYGGLCDLMCNYFTLTNASASVQDKDQLIRNFKVMYADKEKFNYDKMESLSKTHILSLVSFIEIIKFIFFKSVPDNIFKKSEEGQLRTEDKGLNLEVMQDKLETLPIGANIKFSGFRTRYGVPASGHSMLISKVGENEYMFFNPSGFHPSCQFYNAKDLSKVVSDIAKPYDRVAFIDNQKFMQRVEKKLFESPIEKQKNDEKGTSDSDESEENYQSPNV